MGELASTTNAGPLPDVANGVGVQCMTEFHFLRARAPPHMMHAMRFGADTIAAGVDDKLKSERGYRGAVFRGSLLKISGIGSLAV